jgi:hypothetical protein
MICSLQTFIHGCKVAQNVRMVWIWANLLISILDFYLRTPTEEMKINLLVLKFNQYFRDFLLIKMSLLPKKIISSKPSLRFHFFACTVSWASPFNSWLNVSFGEAFLAQMRWSLWTNAYCSLHVGGQMTTYRSQLSPSTTKVLGIELRFQLGTSLLYPLSHLDGSCVFNWHVCLHPDLPLIHSSHHQLPEGCFSYA